MKISFYTLGCRLNQYETDSLISRFKQNGFEIVPFKEYADIYIINTCTVTSRSDYKSRNAISRAVKNNPDAFIIVTGCYVDTNEKDINKISGINLLVANSKKHGIFEIVNEYMQSKQIILPDNNSFNFSPPVLSQRTRNYLKIQDGCDQFCSYCKVPFARGSISRSKKIEEVIYSFSELVDNGIKEIVLTGINIGKYETGIAFLLNKILKINGDFRIHLSSIELNFINDELIELLTEKKICSHLHIPLQSGSDKILKSMNRKYSSVDFINKIEAIRKKLPLINITTDIIVGFPDESVEDFNETINVINKIEFTHIHTFRYSDREGTQAQKMTNKIPHMISSQRSEDIRKISDHHKSKYFEKLKVLNLKVLIEKNKKINNQIYSFGKSHEYADINVKGEHKPGYFVESKLTSIDPLFLVAEKI